MNFLDIAVLALLQGIAEFLPISSSGHLVIVEHFLKISDNNLFINMVLHSGTLFSVILFFRKEIFSLFKNLSYKKNPTLYYLAGATFMTGIAGILIKKIYAEASQIFVVAVFLFINGLILILTRFLKEKDEELNWKKSFFIGLIQGIAVLPGISRSGSTISAGIFSKISKEKAFEFSFLLSIPAVLGASILEFYEMYKNPVSLLQISPVFLTAGFFISFFSGFAALMLLKKIVLKSKFHYFGYYCIFASIITLIGALL